MFKFNLSLDDYSPRQGTNDLTWVNKLIGRFPEIKIDLFVPAAFCRLGEKPNWLSENLNWIERVKQLPSNYNINLHGLYHRRSVKDFVWHKAPESNNDEWQYLDNQKAKKLLNIIEAEFEKVGLKYKKVFRPPAWKISTPAAQLLTDRGYLIAGDELYHNKVCMIKNLKWISYNWNLLNEPPGKKDIVCYGHLSNWTTNYFNEEMYNIVVKVLNKQQFEFKFIEEM